MPSTTKPSWKTPYSPINPRYGTFSLPLYQSFSCTFAPMLNLKSLATAFCLLSISLLFPACNEPDLIGLDLQPTSEQPGVEVDTLEVYSYLVPEDSLIMWSPTKNLIELPTLFLGSYDDVYSGKTFAGFVSQVRIGNTITTSTFGGVTTPDSIVLSLLYKDANGDTTQLHHISVYELTDKLYTDSTYYSAHEYGHSTLLGHVALKPNIKDSVVVGGTNKAPQIRLPLDTAFGGRLLREYISNPANFASNTAFLEYFKGIYLVDSVDGSGSIVSFPSTSGYHRLTLYFSGTKSYEFIIDVNAVRMSYTRNQPPASALDQIPDNDVAVLSMAGLKDSLVVQNIASLYANGPVAISSAKLIFDINSTGLTNNFAPHNNLLIFGSDSTGANITTADALETSSYYGGSFSDATDTYSFNIARYLQQTLKKVVEEGGKDYGLFLVAGGSTSNARRTLLKGQSSIKLIVTTTKINP